MVVHPETVARPLGVSVTVDTSWEGLEDFAMVGGQSKQRTKEQKIPVPSILDRNQSSFSSPTILLTHPPAFILPFHFLSLQLPNTNLFSPPFSFPLPLFSPILFPPSLPPLPFPYYSLFPPPTYPDINECTQENTGCEQGCFNKIGSYKCHCFVGYQRANATHCSKLSLHVYTEVTPNGSLSHFLVQ